MSFDIPCQAANGYVGTLNKKQKEALNANIDQINDETDAFRRCFAASTTRSSTVVNGFAKLAKILCLLPLLLNVPGVRSEQIQTAKQCRQVGKSIAEHKPDLLIAYSDKQCYPGHEYYK